MRSVLPAYLSSGTLTRVLKYFYDDSGNLQCLLSKSDNFSKGKAYNLYYYVRDALGNITSLLKVKTQNGSTGTTDTKTLVAEYKYDAYGQIISATRPSGVTDDIYQVNPICYKDYYYDADTGWYNLTTRYYDPVVGRFISADDVSLIAESTDEMGDKNLYAYCDNNPVMRADASGEVWHVAAGAGIGLVVSFTAQLASNLMSGKRGKAVLDGCGTAAIGGAVYGGVLTATGNALAASVASSATESVIREVRSYKEEGKAVTKSNVLKSFRTIGVQTGAGTATSMATGRSFKAAIKPRGVKFGRSMMNISRNYKRFGYRCPFTKPWLKRSFKYQWRGGINNFFYRFGSSKYKVYKKRYVKRWVYR
jgi:RHS repeat-associated protein